MVNFGNVKSKLNKAYSQDLIDNTNKYKTIRLFSASPQDRP
jgi:hypothetical protein